MPPEFDPSQSTHAIDRCAAHVVFAEVLPDRLFANIRTTFSATAKALGFTAAPIMSFRIDASTGKVEQVQEEGSAPSSFISPDQSVQIALTPNALTWATSKYIRWEPFVGQMDRATSGALKAYLDVVSPKVIRLEYVDSFYWAGTWDDFDAKKLLCEKSGFLAPRPMDAARERHTHTGWFAPVDGMRRLTAANIDIKEGAPSGGTVMKPSVVITTLMQDELNIPGYGIIKDEAVTIEFIFSRLELLHTELKKLITDILVEPMAKRIGLLSE